MLRYAPRFHKKNLEKISPKKILPKKILQKKFQTIFREFFFQFFLAILVPQLIWDSLRKFGGLGTLVWEEIENAQTVHKGLAKLFERSGGGNCFAKRSNFRRSGESSEVFDFVYTPTHTHTHPHNHTPTHTPLQKTLLSTYMRRS
jgi:hypothetical protein